MPLAFCGGSIGDWRIESGISVVPVGVEIPRTKVGIGAWGDIESRAKVHSDHWRDVISRGQ